MLSPARFSALWERLGGTTAAEPIFTALAAAYSEPHRAYHNAEHIVDCLAQFDPVREQTQHPDEVELALWFHDAIYNPRAAANEEQSAAWAERELLAAEVATERIRRIVDLILITKHQRIPPSAEAALLVDVDLSILGREPAEFDAYDRKIRQEYDWVPEPDYRAGRTRVLQSFLQRKVIYQTPYFRDRYESSARVNLTRALERLASGE